MKTIFVLITLLFSSGVWAKTGFYSGVFDPPLPGAVQAIRECLQQEDVDELIIMVERHSECYSAGERAERLKLELQEVKDHVQIMVEPWSGKTHYLKGHEDLIILQNKDTLPLKALQVDDPMNALKYTLHKEAFQAFLREIALLYSDATLLNSLIPQFYPHMSNLGWVDQFIDTVLREKHLSPQRKDEIGNKAEKLLISTERGKPYAKLHCVQRILVEKSAKPDVTVYSLLLPSLPKGEKHTFDVDLYCSDRFPRALFTSGLFNEDSVYFHMGSTEEAIAFHQSEGFTEIYQVHSQAVRKLRNYHLLKHPQTQECRFVISNLHGEDTLHHVAYQFNEVAKFSKAHLVRHANPSPLFVADLRKTFQPQDVLMIGFKNALSRSLAKDPDWKKTVFSETGLDIDLYEHKRTHDRVLLSKCVYGDQLLELLDFFYSRGVRQFQYFGTSGSLSPQIHIGDAVIPLAFYRPQKEVISFQNQALHLLQGIQPDRIKPVTLHGWTQTPVVETVSFLRNLQQMGNQSIDVEARYYGEFFHDHPDAYASLVLFISDEPFGDITLDHFNTMDKYVDEIFNIVVDPCCGHFLRKAG